LFAKTLYSRPSNDAFATAGLHVDDVGRSATELRGIAVHLGAFVVTDLGALDCARLSRPGVENRRQVKGSPAFGVKTTSLPKSSGSRKARRISSSSIMRLALVS
jgi:hypothetical protein